MPGPSRHLCPGPADDLPEASRGYATVALGRFDALVSYGLTQILSQDPIFQIIGADLDNSTLERVVAQRAPKAVLLDEITVGDLAILARLKKAHPELGVGVLVQAPTHADGMRLLAAGASCLPKEASTTDILAAVRGVADGRRLFVRSGQVIERKYPAASTSLTPREIEVLEYLSRGRSNPEIAHALHLSVETIHSHTKRIRSKLGVRNKRDLIGLTIPTHPEVK